jgi:hypothetical protein
MNKNSCWAIVEHRLAWIIGLSIVICSFGQSARTEAAETAGAALEISEAKAIIHRRLELRQDGSIASDIFDKPALMQLSVQECDPEAGRTIKTCVFHIYEIQ